MPGPQVVLRHLHDHLDPRVPLWQCLPHLCAAWFYGVGLAGVGKGRRSEREHARTVLRRIGGDVCMFIHSIR